MVNVPQIPYEGIGLGIAMLAGVWAFLIAETGRDRSIILAGAAVAFGLRVVLPNRTGHLVSLVACMVYGIGCLIFLRLNGLGVR